MRKDPLGRTPLPLVFRRARELRKNETHAEEILWGRLRAKRLNGFRFRRQFPIGRFIVDFCCKEYRLVIELDGGQHAAKAVSEKDQNRTRQIEARGYRVMRFWNRETFENVEGVLEAILNEADKIRTGRIG